LWKKPESLFAISLKGLQKSLNWSAASRLLAVVSASSRSTSTAWATNPIRNYLLAKERQARVNHGGIGASLP
jgi:hypothetical protein